MRTQTKWKMASGMLVLTLLLSSLAFLPGTTVEGASDGNKISLNAVDGVGSPISGVQAVLREVHTLKTYAVTTDTGGLAEFSPWPGYYTLTLGKTGYFDLSHPDVIRFDGLSSVSLGPITMTAQPSRSLFLNITVLKTGTAESVPDVRLRVLDTGHSMQEVFNETSVNGLFSVPVYSATYKLVLSAAGYSVNVTSIISSINRTDTIYMDASTMVRGYVYMSGVPVTTGLKAFLVSTNASLDLEKRIVRPRLISSNYFELDAYPGQFYLLVDGLNAKANMTNMTVAAPQTLTVNLTAQSVQKTTKAISFYEGDWNSFNLTETIEMEYDSTVPGLSYNYLPNIRMQIDFAVGNGDGTITTTEVNAFRSKIFSFGPQNVTTQFLLRVNGTSYVDQPTGFTSVVYTGLTGSVNLTTGYTGTTVALYNSISTLPKSGPLYSGSFYANYDTATMDFMYTIALPDLYEMTANTTTSSFLRVGGYTTVTVDPQFAASTSLAQVSMTFQESKAPTAAAAIVTGTNAYSKLLNSTVLYYIVSQGHNVTFTAAGSVDPNGNPLTYIWDFGDGNVSTVTAVTTTHNYEVSVYNLTVVLTVRDVAGLEDNASFETRIDSVDPSPAISVRNKNVVSNTITVNQTEAIVFNGTDSVDIINSTADPEKGIISSWKWDFGDGNTTTVLLGENQNVTHAYARAGQYTVKLNATDVVGHYAIAQMTVVVKDTTAPVVSFAIKDAAFKTVSTAMENTTLYFDASATTDNVDSLQNLTFLWEFGDGDTSDLVNATHNYTNIKTFTVKLTVTDKSGNEANLTKTIAITSSARPDLRVTSLTFDPATFTEGDLGTMRLNVTNVGNANATSIVATFYRVTSTGEKVILGTSDDLTVNGTAAALLRPNSFGIITFQWRAESKGNYTIFAEVTSALEINKADNSQTTSLNVNEAGWKAAAIYGGIFAVIIVVIILIYMRKRLPLPSRKGKQESKPEQKGKK